MEGDPLTLSLKTAHKALPTSVYTRKPNGFVATFEVDEWPGLVVQTVSRATVTSAGVYDLPPRFTEVFTDLPGRDYSEDHFVVPESWMRNGGGVGGAMAFVGTARAVLQDRHDMTHNGNERITRFTDHQKKREEALKMCGLQQGTPGVSPWGTAYGSDRAIDADMLGTGESSPMERRAILVWDAAGKMKLFAEHGATNDKDPLELNAWRSFLSNQGSPPPSKAPAPLTGAITTFEQAADHFNTLMQTANVRAVIAESEETSDVDRESSPEYHPDSN